MSSARFKSLSALSLALLLLSQNQIALASIKANRSLTNSGITGVWSSNVTSSNGNPTNSTYQITWTGSANKLYELISIVNTGNFDLIAGHLTFSTAKSNGDTTNPPNLTFETCTGSWDPTNFACSGAITQVGSATSGQININRYLMTANRLVLRVTNSRNSVGNQITTFNSQSFRSDIRNGLVINS